MNKYINRLEVATGLALVIVGYVYITTPANALPQFFPGYDEVTTGARYVHGVIALILGLVVFLVAAFQNPRRSYS